MQDVFQSKPLAMVLLAAHVGVLLLFADRRWCVSEGGLCRVCQQFWRRSVSSGQVQYNSLVSDGGGKHGRGVSKSSEHGEGQILSPAHVLLVLFSGNFVGIVFARTLHYQFYSWYFHTLPLLLWAVRIPTVLRLGLWAVVEIVWNVYPPSGLSSVALLVCHGIVLAALWARPVAFEISIGVTGKLRTD